MWARHLNGQRRERDSNPRHLRAAVFKTAPFNRSGISPGPLCLYNAKMVLDRSRVVNSLLRTFFIPSVYEPVVHMRFVYHGHLPVGVKYHRGRRGIHYWTCIVFGNTDRTNEALLRGEINEPNPLGIASDTPDVCHLQAHQVPLIAHNHDVVIVKDL